MAKNYANKSHHGREPIMEVAQIPFALIQAQTALIENFEYVDGDKLKGLVTAYDLIHSILNFIAGGDCDLSALQLTNAQREAVKRMVADPDAAAAYLESLKVLGVV